MSEAPASDNPESRHMTWICHRSFRLKDRPGPVSSETVDAHGQLPWQVLSKG